MKNKIIEKRTMEITGTTVNIKEIDEVSELTAHWLRKIDTFSESTKEGEWGIICYNFTSPFPKVCDGILLKKKNDNH